MPCEASRLPRDQAALGTSHWLESRSPSSVGRQGLSVRGELAHTSSRPTCRTVAAASGSCACEEHGVVKLLNLFGRCQVARAPYLAPQGDAGLAAPVGLEQAGEALRVSLGVKEEEQLAVALLQPRHGAPCMQGSLIPANPQLLPLGGNEKER
jgi:hypothetical protein